jgi:hypothetical protein
VTLVEEITRAHIEVARGEPGAKARLERLQDEYRSSGASITRPGPSVQLVEPGASRHPSLIRKPALSRAATATSSGPKVRFRERPAVGLTIRLEPQVRRQIEDELSWCRNGAFPDREFRESGGYLYSLWRPGLDQVTLHLASGPGPDSEHAREAMLFSPVERIEADLFATRDRDAYHRCGCWHSHPSSDDTPSPADMQSWALRSKRAGPMLSGWASLIVTRSDEGTGWMFPRFNGFVTYGAGVGYVSERAKVVDV